MLVDDSNPGGKSEHLLWTWLWKSANTSVFGIDALGRSQGRVAGVSTAVARRK